MMRNKKQEAEVTQAYKAYFDSYIKGDINTIESLLDDDYNQIGSAESEVFFNKKEAMNFLRETIDQVAGKTEIRNRVIKVDPLNELFLVTDLFDIYASIEDDWSFYAKFRASTLMQQKEGGWKFIHQHSSMPDTRTQEGENIAIEKISAENLQLREAVKRRTIELEHKNRDLQIEAALERVRARAMAMQNSTELAELVATLFKELNQLDFALTRCYIYIIDPDSFALRAWTFNREIDELPESYFIQNLDVPYYKALIKAWKERNPKFVYELGGEEKKETDRVLFTETEYSRLPESVKSGMMEADRVFLSYSFNNFGGLQTGGLEPLSDKNLDILSRFGKVFDLTYTRFNDLQKAEAQAREAKIEAALERVRSRSLAMHKTDELQEVVRVVAEELKSTGVILDTWGAVICTYFQDSKDVLHWTASEDPANPSVAFLLPYFEDELFDEAWESKERDDSYFAKVFSFEVKNAFFNHAFEHSDYRQLPDDYKKQILESETHGIAWAWAKNSAIMIPSIQGDLPSEDEKEILIRFARVFEQSFIRFLDLQKAEAQAREAQIEAALERVRSRTMGMQHSTELAQTANLMFEQIQTFGVDIWSCGFNIWKKEERIFTSWMSSKGILLPPMQIPLTENIAFIHFDESRRRGDSLFVDEMSGEILEEHYRYMTTLPGIKETFEVIADSGLTLPSYQINHLANFSHGNLMFITYEPCPQLHDVFKRFAKVFEQTYARFLDLQKAEAQAREAEIQLALERVRARTMAMHKSEELAETVAHLFKQLEELGIKPYRCNLAIVDSVKEHCKLWSTTNEGNVIPFAASLPLTKSIMKKMYEGWKKQEHSTQKIVGTKRLEWINYLNNYVNFKEYKADNIDPDKLKKEPAIFNTFSFKQGFFVIHTVTDLKKTELETIQRFAKVFEQTYTRFLDLQKAEAQAREAQIETALERVRSRTMAMQRSEELAEVATVLFQQVKALGVPQWTCGFNIFEIDDKEFTWYPGSPEGEILEPCKIPLTEHPVFISFNESRKRGDELFVYEKEGKFQADHYRYMLSLPIVGDFLQRRLDAGIPFPTFQIDHLANFSHGNLIFVTYEPVPEMHDVFKRFAKVFEQTYTRFLDLQKSEAQARESQIEAALERVRARTMAMQNSSELAETSVDMFKQMQALGMRPWACGFNIFDKDEKAVTQYMAGGDGLSRPFTMPLTEEPFFIRISEARQRDVELFVMESGGQELEETYKYMFSLPGSQKALGDLMVSGFEMPKFQISHCAFFSQGYLLFITYEPYPEAHDIFKRFAKVFEQTYTRFLDLQKAEAQAREAQIEAALERVRSRSMAMHQSNELNEVATVLFQQLRQLGGNLWTCGVSLCQENSTVDDFRVALENGMAPTILIPNNEDPVHIKMYEGWRNKMELFTETKSGEELKTHYEYLKTVPTMRPVIENLIASGVSLPLWQKWHAAYFSHGYLLIITVEPYPQEEVFKRFAKVFEQAYTRFLDLKRAEAQARVAQIEAAMERIRSRALAMRNSEELMEVITELRRQIDSLGQLDLEASVVHLYTDSADMFESIAAVRPPGESGDIVLANVFFPVDASDRIKYMIEMYQSPENEYTIEFDKEMAEEWQQVMVKYAPMIAERREGFVDNRRLSDRSEYWNFSDFSEGSLLLVTHSPASDDTKEVLRKASIVFDLAYRRYKDLRKAEERAREAQIEASLERVRSRTLAMQKSDELAETSSVLFQQLIQLGIEPNRLYIAIIDDNSSEGEFWLSDEKGTKISSAYTADLTANPTFNKMFVGWKEQRKSILIEIQGKELKAYVEHLTKLNVPFKGGLTQKRRLQYLAYFSKGFIGMASPDDQSSDTLQLLERFASVFNLTFTRFHDLKVAEANALKAEEDLIEIKTARQKAEQALVELKAAQSQLIQAEKMASLGELTAGIAHEIQNPLNFVNNFSELNKELILELKEELEKGDLEEIKAIADDIFGNEDKINHHGQRASSIVKGMLEHSRTGTRQKELTDINILTDEYLRLSYHGLRAKDKFFNAEFKVDLDPALPKVNVIGQDIGRVLLNLINNAFYAVSEKAKKGIDGYAPRVTVKTKKVDHLVEIRVKDNADGIPPDIVNKIFQPFFTTKPTGSGTGLGLSLSYDIVTMGHNGTLEVDTTEGLGSEFIIQLPIV